MTLYTLYTNTVILFFLTIGINIYITIHILKKAHQVYSYFNNKISLNFVI